MAPAALRTVAVVEQAEAREALSAAVLALFPVRQVSVVAQKARGPAVAAPACSTLERWR